MKPWMKAYALVIILWMAGLGIALVLAYIRSLGWGK